LRYASTVDSRRSSRVGDDEKEDEEDEEDEETNSEDITHEFF